MKNLKIALAVVIVLVSLASMVFLNTADTIDFVPIKSSELTDIKVSKFIVESLRKVALTVMPQA